MDSHALSFHALAQFNCESHGDIHNLPHNHEDISTLKPLEDETPIPLTSRVMHKFYEPVMLLISLIDVIKLRSPQPSVSEASPNGLENDRQAFKAFVNKLAHVCSSSKGRETVTSFLVLRDRALKKGSDGRIHYWFTANEQKTDDLIDTQVYVQKLLRRVGQAPGDSEGLETVRKELHRDILVFNRPRISSYLREIQRDADSCVRRCALEDTDESESQQ